MCNSELRKPNQKFTPRWSENLSPKPPTTLADVIAMLRREGYAPTHWVVDAKGIRAESTGEGKVGIPSSYAVDRVCMVHGNLVKVRRETHPERSDKGVRILDVIPCPFCVAEPIRTILRAPLTR